MVVGRPSFPCGFRSLFRFYKEFPGSKSWSHHPYHLPCHWKRFCKKNTTSPPKKNCQKKGAVAKWHHSIIAMESTWAKQLPKTTTPSHGQVLKAPHVSNAPCCSSLPEATHVFFRLGSNQETLRPWCWNSTVAIKLHELPGKDRHIFS